LPLLKKGELPHRRFTLPCRPWRCPTQNPERQTTQLVEIGRELGAPVVERQRLDHKLIDID
jgi:hypothetical protein